MRSKIQYLGRSLHIAHSNKLNELILDMYRVWSIFAINLGFPLKIEKCDQTRCIFEISSSSSIEFYGRNTLNIEFLTSYTLVIRVLKNGRSKWVTIMHGNSPIKQLRKFFGSFFNILSWYLFPFRRRCPWSRKELIHK